MSGIHWPETRDITCPKCGGTAHYTEKDETPGDKLPAVLTCSECRCATLGESHIQRVLAGDLTEFKPWRTGTLDM